MASEAYMKLVGLAFRGRESAQELPYKTEAQAMWSGIGFSMGGVNYVVAMGEVVEILSLPKFSQVPGVREWVLGVANVRGRLLLISDLLSYLNQSSGMNLRHRRLLVIERGDLYSGLTVDEILGMQHLPANSFIDAPSGLDDVIARYVTGAFKLESGELWHVFSMNKLAEDPDFLRAAS